MKQKFTLNIADIQISVIADAAPDEVEHIRGLLDRKMREIYVKSRCPKTEAALLCAMDFAADRMNMQNQIAELDERCDKYAIVLENLKERNEDQLAELERLRSENAVLRSLLTKKKEEEEAQEAKEEESVALDPISPAAFFAEVAEAQTQNAALLASTRVSQDESVDEYLYEDEDEDDLAEEDEEIPAPVMEAAVEDEPVAEEYAEDELFDEPFIEESAEDEPLVEESAEDESFIEAPVADEPVAEEPAKDEPVKAEPVKTEPVKAEHAKTEPAKASPIRVQFGRSAAKPASAKPAEAKSAPVNVLADPVKSAPAEEPIPRPRSRVGNMFRHLSFGDVD